MIKRQIFFVVIASLLLILTACGDKLPIETNMSEEVADFSFTNQYNESFSLDDLEGTWWIADFVFTNCTTVCLPMTSNMAKLQTRIADENFPVQLVSFSVDPDYDTPEVLETYGNEYGSDFETWTFLTGYDFDTIKQLSIKSFRALLKEPKTSSDEVMHDTRFFLVDPEGNIVKGYDGVKTDSLDDIMEDLASLNKENLLQ
ncbi:SCO family protein [Pseudogracilibacillus sp. ICA-222130]|uniref:SCO family protein n=1 Tax=Pseudogracilibacillus sp. ICA-222130 TaxID=3134655 RepID=UPI0030BA6288